MKTTKMEKITKKSNTSNSNLSSIEAGNRIIPSIKTNVISNSNVKGGLSGMNDCSSLDSKTYDEKLKEKKNYILFVSSSISDSNVRENISSLKKTKREYPIDNTNKTKNVNQFNTFTSKKEITTLKKSKREYPIDNTNKTICNIEII